ncbi:uncharacterized protein isoform X2 [Choristoneura fumiferana]|uniref:uncharacterized protein isoform X2 n=1 Tax=Choristoneura fumiferana TaxID=7141 RepID=UPI003D1597F7
MVLIIKMFSNCILALKCLVSSIAWYIFPNAEIEVSESLSEDGTAYDSETDEEIPSIFVDEHLLPTTTFSRPNDNDTEHLTDINIYSEAQSFSRYDFSDLTVEEPENLRNFEVWTANMEEEMDSVDMSVDDDRYLDEQLQVVPQGLILNSNLYLSNQQWNTIVYTPEFTFYCAVCASYCDDTEHIILDSHKHNLSKHKPLYKYDLSIVRKIIDYLHCGVCNLLFHESQEDDHFASKDHEDKMLFAINKASDIMYDSNINNDKTETYHFSAKAINNNNIDVPSSDDDDNESNSDFNDYGNSYGALKYVENEVDEDDDDFYDNVEPPLTLEHSYASMARRPKTDELPKVLEIDLGNKKVTVNYNSWNMVINPKPNRYYCMVCTTFGHIRVQAEHCRSLEHVERLAKCRLIDAYDLHLVRQVDDKLYHCGHCNNLQLIHDMPSHIEAHHPNRPSTDSPAKPSTPLKTPSKIRPTVFNDKENCKNMINNNTVKQLNFDNENSLQSKNNKHQNISQEKLQMCQDMLLANSNIFDDIVICTYGKKITISKMAYNIMCERENDFYCGLCETMVEQECIKDHVNDLQHIFLLQNTPFIEAFNVHLFRQIREALHCALCNVLIQLIPAMISSHKFEPKHANRVLEAVRDIPKEKTPVSIKETKPVDTGKKTMEVATVNNKYNEANGNKAVTVSEEGKNDDTDSDEDVDEFMIEDFDFEEHVYVKLGNSFAKVTNTAYNTLVAVGDGTRYCFVCSAVVDREVKKHVDSRGHVDNIDKYMFVEKYKEDLLRQIYLTYHCCICNVLISRKQLSQHLSWPTHVIQAENTKISAKQRKTDIKNGLKQYNINTVKENIYLNETEAKVKIHLNVAMEKDNIDVARKNKIVIFNSNVLKISFDAWHSLSELPEGWKCKMCQCEFSGMELGNHIASEWHVGSLEKFDLKCSLALMRKINDTLMNCVMCNAEIPNKESIMQEHVHGKKHKKVFQNILDESAVANSYTDCDENVLQL